jgi:hypothetical protein
MADNPADNRGPKAWQAQQTSAFCSLMGRRCHSFPLLSARQMGTHYPIWLLRS